MYHVYIVTNQRNGTLYTGVTSDLRTRIWQHKNKALPGFTAQYGLNLLVYFEEYRDISRAIDREKADQGGLEEKEAAAYRAGQSAMGRFGGGLVLKRDSVIARPDLTGRGDPYRWIASSLRSSP